MRSGFILKWMIYRPRHIKMIWQMDQSAETDSRLLKHSWQPLLINLLGLISISIYGWPKRNQQWTICMMHHYVHTAKLILYTKVMLLAVLVTWLRQSQSCERVKIRPSSHYTSWMNTKDENMVPLFMTDMLGFSNYHLVRGQIAFET